MTMNKKQIAAQLSKLAQSIEAADGLRNYGEQEEFDPDGRGMGNENEEVELDSNLQSVIKLIDKEVADMQKSLSMIESSMRVVKRVLATEKDKDVTFLSLRQPTKDIREQVRLLKSDLEDLSADSGDLQASI